jgi:hypothetical protein
VLEEEDRMDSAAGNEADAELRRKVEVMRRRKGMNRVKPIAIRNALLSRIYY